VKECVGVGLVDENASEPNSVEGDEGLDKGSSSVEVATGLARRNG
jgi:hypothetical protein